MIYTHLKCSNQFKLRRYAMLRIAGQPRPRGKQLWLGSRARRRKAAGAHSLSVRRVPPWLARVYECKHVSGADGMCPRLALTVKPKACGFFSFFSCPYKKRTRFSFPKENKDVVFSPTRKRRKESLRLPPQTPMLLPESIYTRLSTVVCSRFARQANIRRAESMYG